MDELPLMLPPQIEVGEGRHTLEVRTQAWEGSLLVELTHKGGTTSSYSFTAPNEQQILAWIAEQGHKIGQALDKAQKMRLRRAGYKV